jgi:hypothetical protein
MLAHTAFGQGTVIFANRGGANPNAAPGQVVAPIYREDPNDPTFRIAGNTSSGIPAGNTSYNGAAFVAAGQGPTFIATLWGLNTTFVTGNAAENNLLLLENGTTTFGTATLGPSAGMVNQPPDPATVPGVIGDSSDRGSFQVRVWDSRNGSIATWGEVMLPENNSVLRGYSDLFTVPFPLGASLALYPPPYLQGLQSFNLFIVPEPSVFALAGLAAAGLLILRQKRNLQESEHRPTLRLVDRFGLPSEPDFPARRLNAAVCGTICLDFHGKTSGHK